MMSKSIIRLMLMVSLIVLSFGYTTTEAHAGAYDQLVDIAGGDVPDFPTPEPVCYAYYDENGNLVYATESNPCPDSTPITTVKQTSKQTPSKTTTTKTNTNPDCARAVFDGVDIPGCEKSSQKLPVIPVINYDPIIRAINNKFFNTFNWFRPQEIIVKAFTKPASPDPAYPHLKYGEKANQDEKAITSCSKGIIEGILKDAGINHEITITSTYRNSEDQARAMFNNLEKRKNRFASKMGEINSVFYAVQKEKKLYCNKTMYTKYERPGCKVIDVYYGMRVDAFFNDEDIKAAMTVKIESFLKEKNKRNEPKPRYVSRHMRNIDTDKLNVIDIAPSSFTKKENLDFEAAVEKAEREGKITKFLHPPDDESYHIEVNQAKCSKG